MIAGKLFEDINVSNEADLLLNGDINPILPKSI